MSSTGIKKTAVLGFGNPVRADDGVGIYVIEQLKNQLGESEHLSIFDMGTAAFEILFKLKGHERIILIDAVINTGEKVGTTYKLPASEVEGQIEDDPMVFLHSLKWNQALSYAKKMLRADYPKHIDVYLIAIDSTRFNVGMTEEAKTGGDKIVGLLLEELK
ncbi:MAG: hydrogenase maturation protease [Saprospiraceae bacterium]|jgi:hydrogenase maturation protease|nr:hydrogenase maturation protease [Saprospiraceae bacterium]